MFWIHPLSISVKDWFLSKYLALHPNIDNLVYSTSAKILTELDISKGLPKEIWLKCKTRSGNKLSIMKIQNTPHCRWRLPVDHIASQFVWETQKRSIKLQSGKELHTMIYQFTSLYRALQRKIGQQIRLKDSRIWFQIMDKAHLNLYQPPSPFVAQILRGSSFSKVPRAFILRVLSMKKDKHTESLNIALSKD